MKEFRFRMFPLVIVIAWSIVASCGPKGGGSQHSKVKRPEDYCCQAPPKPQFAAIKRTHKATGVVAQNTPGPLPADRPTSVSKTSGATRENAGALIYADDSGKTYALIAFSKHRHKWANMKGSVEKGDSYAETARNEVFEETAGVYDVAVDILESLSYSVYTNSQKNFGMTFFLKMPFVDSARFVKAAAAATDHRFSEMTDYRWIELDDLKAALQNDTRTFQANTSAGKTETFDFDAYSFTLLKDLRANSGMDHLE